MYNANKKSLDKKIEDVQKKKKQMLSALNTQIGEIEYKIPNHDV